MLLTSSVGRKIKNCDSRNSHVDFSAKRNVDLSCSWSAIAQRVAGIANGEIIMFARRILLALKPEFVLGRSRDRFRERNASPEINLVKRPAFIRALNLFPDALWG